ncbi:helix-turn-helix transcriptional regulator [Plantactinospora sp. S1510]|uniref:Helix-turn-helix transcriptional regulator n=1 Tax=Plantactinospora alkalitolerans TaxID=2789879 RepID=A0ABS0GYP7_9ACTN|nr:helix-turn-helix domain-containing protein [Plantactinospora alkalitolerans]MBF9131338.1 helix-turn-helix transcriptional regulator [Plantactinospora alkalitolerans]
MSLGVDDPDRQRAADDTPDPKARLRALAHPLRMRILSLLTTTAMTAAEVARELDLTHANASYHLRHLLAAGLVEAAGEERIRGGVAKRYRHDPTIDHGWRAPVPEGSEATPEHRLVYAALSAELRRRSAELLRGPGSFLTDAEFWVDPETWTEIRDAIAEASARLHQAARPPRTPGTQRVSATVALFRMKG